MKKLLLVTWVIVLMSAAVFGNHGKAAVAEEKTIKIGALLPLTGPHAMWGSWYDHVFKFALDEAGWKVAGKKIKLIVEDEGGININVALDKAKKLVGADKVDLILGPFIGGAHFSVLPYTSSLPLVDIIYTHPSPVKEELINKYAFWMSPSYGDTTYPVGLYAYDVLGYRTVTTIATDHQVGRDFLGGFTSKFKSRGGKVIQQQWHPITETDFIPYLTNLKMADAMVTSSLGPPAQGRLYAQYDQLGLFKRMPILIAEAGSIPPSYMPSWGDKIVGIVGSHKYLPRLDNPENKKFFPAYTAKYKEIPDDKIVDGYITIRVLLAALEATGGNTDPDTLKAALLKTEMDTPSGHFRFCPGRVAVQDIYVTEVKKIGGEIKWEVIKTYPAVEPTCKTYP